MPTRIEVRGLKKAAENLHIIGSIGGKALSRDALRDGARIIVRALKAATYQNFQRRTGAIKAGFAARVAQDFKSGLLRGYVVQMGTALALRAKKTKRGKPQTEGVAYWWRFLEFGTQGRRTARTPKFLRKGRMARGKRQLRAFARYSAAKSLGDITPRNWVRPAFGGSAAGAIETFGKSFRTRIEAEVGNLSKK